MVTFGIILKNVLLRIDYTMVHKRNMKLVLENVVMEVISRHDRNGF